MSSTVLRSKGQVTIPSDIRQAARLEEGDPMEVELVADGILLRPRKVIDATQAWFWAPAWQAGEAEASAELAAAYRVWCGAFIDAGGGTIDLQRATHAQAVEYLCRALLESHLSNVCSGRHTNMVPLVMGHVRTVFGHDAPRILTECAHRVDRDCDARWGAVKTHQTTDDGADNVP